MAYAKITLIGAMTYFDQRHMSLFDYLDIPEGLDKEILIDDLVYRGCDFELLHINPEYTRFALGAFSKKWMPTWQHWYDVLDMEYNPIHNYDRIEDVTDKHTGTQGNVTNGTQSTANTGTQNIANTGTQTTANTGTQTTANTGTQQNAKSETENTTSMSTETGTIDKDGNNTKLINDTKNTDETVTNKVAAFNDSNWSNHDHQDRDVDEVGQSTETNTFTEGEERDLTTEGTGSRTLTGSDTRTDNLTELRTDALNEQRTDNLTQLRTDNLNESVTSSETGTRTDNLTDKHDAHIYGNIGVKTTQSMIMEEIDLRKFNLIGKINDMIMEEFMILIY